jgi:hypothetical protein
MGVGVKKTRIFRKKNDKKFKKVKKKGGKEEKLKKKLQKVHKITLCFSIRASVLKWVI